MRKQHATSSTCLLHLPPKRMTTAHTWCYRCGWVWRHYAVWSHLVGAFGNRFQSRCMSQWLARLWSRCDDLDIFKTRLFRLQDWLYWGGGKRSHGSNSSTSPSSCHISPSNALLCIHLQSSSHSVPTNFSSMKPLQTARVGQGGLKGIKKKTEVGNPVASSPHISTTKATYFRELSVGRQANH
jgi:hypothetical protein